MKLISLDYHAPKGDLNLDTLPVIIGSSHDAGICLRAPSVSPFHCRIEWSAGKLIVSDLGSLHGTFLHGARIHKAVLTPGDELAIGMWSFYVQGPPEHQTPSKTAERTAPETTGPALRGVRHVGWDLLA